jgi:hypothetical protein
MLLHHPPVCPRFLVGITVIAACGAGDPPPGSKEFVESDREFVEPQEFRRTGYLQAEGLNESSGVAASKRHPGLLWTHNDSGDDAVLYLTNLEGEDLGRLILEGARARDWEDVTLGPCPTGGSDCLYIADTGDNNHARSGARIYVVREPETVPLEDTSSAEGWHINIYYPDRPFNIEAIAASPKGDLWMISKGLADTAIFVFRVRQSELTHETIDLEPLMRLDFDPAPILGQLVTGAAISPDGKTLVARTYTQIFFYEIEGDGLRRTGACWLGYREPQGEAVDFLDDKLLVLTSESESGSLAPISVVSCVIPS